MRELRDIVTTLRILRARGERAALATITHVRGSTYRREGARLLIQEDGTQVPVKEDEVIELQPGRRFKKAPRFVRG